MAQEVGVAYVTLLPSGRGFGKSVEGQIDSAIGKSEKKTDGFFSKVGTGIKRVGLGVAALAGTVGTIAVSGGISRALNIEDAQAKLKGLGHDTKSVEAIMTNALASVKGTAFGLDAAATTAASAVASGIKPGQELERYLRLTADAATIAGVSMEEMGSIINKVQAKGVAQMDDLNRLTERGVPILQMLANEYGVTAEEMAKMVSDGEVNAERFRKALEDNVAGAALESGNTTRGAFANMRAALSRFGLVFVEDGLAGAKTFFNEITVILDGLAERFKPWVADVNASLGEAFNPEGFGERFLAAFDRFVVAVENGPIPQLMSALAPALPALTEMAEIVGGALGDAFLQLGEALAPVLPLLSEALADAVVELAPSLTDLLVALLPLIPSLTELLVAVLPLVVALLEGLIPAVDFLVGSSENAANTLQSLIGVLQGENGADAFAQDLLDLGGPAVWIAGVFRTVAAGMDFMVSRVVAGATLFRDAISAGFNSAVSRISSSWATAQLIVSTGVNAMVNAVRQIPGFFMGVFAGAGGWLVQAGRDVIQGLINGVSSMIGNAVAAVQSVGGAMLDGVKAFLGIHSPSRVFRDEVGKMVGLGLLEGVADRSIAGRIDSAVSHLVSVPEDARSAAFPGSIVLVDEDGSILTRARVITDGLIDRFVSQQNEFDRRAAY